MQLPVDNIDDDRVLAIAVQKDIFNIVHCRGPVCLNL